MPCLCVPHHEVEAANVPVRASHGELLGERAQKNVSFNFILLNLGTRSRHTRGHRGTRLPLTVPGRPTARQTLVLALLFAMLGLLPQALSRTLPDIAFPLWAADRMQHGARLYVDILEINPPLFIWLDLPLTWLASVIGIGAITWYRVATTLLLLASLVGSWWALNRGLDDEPPAYRRLLWLAAAFALLLLPRLDWGEREHLSLALTLPYIFLGIARARGKSVEKGGALLAGLAAGIGIALKPHFVLVWLGREIGVWMGGGSRVNGQRSTVVDRRLSTVDPASEARFLVNAETLTVPLVCVGYLVAVILIHPEYFQLLRELGWAYQKFLRNSVLITLFLGEGSAIVLGALIVALALRQVPKHGDVWRVLVCSMLGYFLAAVIQAKGWRYHFYPALGLAMLLFAAMAWDAWREGQSSRLMRIFAAIPAAALVTGVVVSAALAVRQMAEPLDPRYDPDPSLSALIPIVKERAAGRPVFVISPNMASGFPLTNYAGNRWVQRLSHLWPEVVAYDSATGAAGPLRYRSLDGMKAVERLGLEASVEDFLRARPPLVLSLIAVDRPGWGMQRLDLLRWLRRDSRFGTAWAAYDSLGRVGNYTVWARRGDPLTSAPLPALSAGRPSLSTGPSEVRVNPFAVFAAGLFLFLLLVSYRRLKTELLHEPFLARRGGKLG